MDAEMATMSAKQRRRRNRRSQIDGTPSGSGDKKSIPSDIGLEVELRAVNEDVSTVPFGQKQLRQAENRVVTGAERVCLPPFAGDERLPCSGDKDCNKVYIEKNLCFKTKPIDQFEHQQAAKRRSLQEATRVEGTSEQANLGLRFALWFHAFLQTVGRMVLGLMAGASLVQTLYVQSFTVTNEVELSGRIVTRSENGLLMVQRYGAYAEPVAIAYYIAFILSGSFILDRFDVGHITSECVIECVTFGNGAIGVLLFIGAFGINNTMAWFDYRLIDLASKPSGHVVSLWAMDGGYESDLRVWRVLDACRTALLLATWIVVNVSGIQYDRLAHRLQTDSDTEEDAYRLVH